MGFELFQRKQQAYNDMMQAVERIKAVLPDLAPEEKQALLDGLRNLIEAHQSASATVASSWHIPSPEAGISQLSPPGAAVESLVHQHPEGIRAREIIERCLDRIATTSDDPKSVLYSAIATLKRNKRICQDPVDKKYRPPRAKQSESGSSPRASLAGRGGPECCERILREHGTPMSARAIATEAMKRGFRDRCAKTAANSEEAVDSVARKLAKAMSGDGRFDEPTPGTFVLKE